MHSKFLFVELFSNLSKKSKNNVFIFWLFKQQNKKHEVIIKVIFVLKL